MLKRLHKTFLISILSWSLLSLQMSVAFAGVNESNNNITTDSSGSITSKKTYTFDNVKESDMLASIAMLAGGAITARMVKNYKPLTTDVMIAGAGGAAFIAGEVLSNMKFKGTIDEMTLTVEKKNDQTINEEQQQRIMDMKASYEEARKATNTKRTLQLASAAAFGAAALTAGYMAFKEAVEIGICRTAFQTAKATASACSTTGCAPCLTSLMEHELMFNKFTISRETLTTSAVNDAKSKPIEAALAVPLVACKVLPAVEAPMLKCSNALKTLIANKTKALAPAADVGTLDKSLINKILNLPVTASVTKESKSSYLEKVLDLFFPKANASWIPLLGFSAAAVATFYLVTGDLALMVDNLMFVPRNRAIAFGLLSGLAYFAAKSSENTVKTIDEHIKKLDSILSDIEKLGKGVKGKSVKQLAISTLKPSVKTTIPSTNSSTNTPCLTSNGSTNCSSSTSTLNNTAGFKALPDSLQALAMDTISVGDGVSGTSSLGAGTLSAAESLANKQGAISKALKQNQAEYTKLTKGKATPEQQKDHLLKAMGARIKKSLGNKGMTPSSFMGSTGAAPLDSSSVANISNTNTKEEIILKGSGAAPDVIDLSASKSDSLGLDFKDESASNGIGIDAVAKNETIPEYEINGSEISGENGPSIFEVISSRYLKSGYPKLLEVEPTKK